MADRSVSTMQAERRRQEEYVRSLAGTPPSPAEQIVKAKELLGSDAISPDEYASLKKRALG